MGSELKVFMGVEAKLNSHFLNSCRVGLSAEKTELLKLLSKQEEVCAHITKYNKTAALLSK